MKKHLLKVYRLSKRILKRLRNYVLIAWQPVYHATGAKLECNVCKNQFNQFDSDLWHAHCNCPVCGSSVRLRLLVAALEHTEKFAYANIIQNKRILHFAPERPLGELLKKRAASYQTADFLAEGYSYKHIDHNIDISNMHSINDASYDCVIACDVLEHVPDDLKGIREVHRILNMGGVCIFTVPQKDHLKTTFEDDHVTDKKERERLFGQEDHLRIYGEDFVERMTSAGFTVSTLDENDFSAQMVTRNVLFPPILSTHPLATNYRKIFFGLKTSSDPR
ncbi:MAG: methyltransferase domain-containing protein [Bacteroidales bacterium]